MDFTCQRNKTVTLYMMSTFLHNHNDRIFAKSLDVFFITLKLLQNHMLDIFSLFTTLMVSTSNFSRIFCFQGNVCGSELDFLLYKNRGEVKFKPVHASLHRLSVPYIHARYPRTLLP